MILPYTPWAPIPWGSQEPCLPKLINCYSTFREQLNAINCQAFVKNPGSIPCSFLLSRGFPGGAGGKESACQCKRCKRYRFDPWVRKIPWRRKWQATPVLFPGESHGQRSLAGYSPWGGSESGATECAWAYALSCALTVNTSMWQPSVSSSCPFSLLCAVSDCPYLLDMLCFST